MHLLPQILYSFVNLKNAKLIKCFCITLQKHKCLNLFRLDSE